MKLKPGDCVIVKNTDESTHLEVVDQVKDDGTVVTIASAKHVLDKGTIVGAYRMNAGIVKEIL